MSNNQYVSYNVERKKNTSRAKQLTTIEKKKLAALIREREELWNADDPSNKDVNAHERAWREVANELVKPVEMCKLSWKSLKDCYRYRRKVGEKMRDNGEIKDPMDYVESNWEFAEDISFLSRRVSRPKGRYITYTEDDDVYNEPEHDDSSNVSYCVKQEYLNEHDPIESNHASKKSRMEVVEQIFDNDDVEETTEFALEPLDTIEAVSTSLESSNLVNQLGKLVQAQTEFVREFKGNGINKLAFKTQLIAVDALLQQLPKKTANKTVVEMQNYVLKKVNEYHRNKSDSD